MIVGSAINYRSKLLSSLGFKYFYNQDCIYNWKNQLLRAKYSFVIVFLKTGVCIISYPGTIGRQDYFYSNVAFI